jgi:N-carbamoylputrescine amidase
MKATITQFNHQNLESDWADLIQHIQANQSEFVLLPEMCFSQWFCMTDVRDDMIWESAVESHDRWLKRMPELGAPIVVGTAPRNIDGKRYNVAYVWTADTGIQWIHSKTYLPNDEGYWEATWYDRASIDFQAVAVNDLKIGVMICTEIWFMQHAREYGQDGVHLIVNPRSTPITTNDKWLACGRTAGVIAGAYCLSSNHAGVINGMKLGGAGWLSDPDSVILGITSEEQPFITIDLDLNYAESAKNDYPRYVDDSEI